VKGKASAEGKKRGPSKGLGRGYTEKEKPKARKGKESKGTLGGLHFGKGVLMAWEQTGQVGGRTGGKSETWMKKRRADVKRERKGGRKVRGLL